VEGQGWSYHPRSNWECSYIAKQGTKRKEYIVAKESKTIIM
jgi:hypothetical protein